MGNVNYRVMQVIYTIKFYLFFRKTATKACTELVQIVVYQILLLVKAKLYEKIELIIGI